MSACQGWGATARAHVRDGLLYPRNSCTDCVHIWYAHRGRLGRWLPQAGEGPHGWVSRHVARATRGVQISDPDPVFFFLYPAKIVFENGTKS